jgi:hypothetical protein
MFVNPLPNLKASHLLQFDYPADKAKPKDYVAPNLTPNLNIEAFGIEQMYGSLGTPGKEQGHPCLYEVLPVEAEDPNVAPYQDQIIDIDRKAIICHTGRLSGSFVRFLACDHIRSIVRVVAHPLTNNNGVVQIATLTSSLEPKAPAANVWFWKNAATRDELLYTAYVQFDPRQAGLRPENVYRLILRWEFVDTGITPNERLPISGFDETVSFEVINRTVNL